MTSDGVASRTATVATAALLATALASQLFAGCSPTVSRGGSDGGGSTVDMAPSSWTDFPRDPVIDSTGGAVPANVAMLFGATGSASGGPCLVEPEAGALFPSNWLRPRFHFIPTASENLFEIRLHAAAETNDLVVFTAARTFTMPASMWRAIAAHIVDQPITVTIRGAVFDGTSLTSGPSAGSTSDFRIAPVQASGSIVYWTTTGGSALKGFAIGDETVRPVLTPAQASTQCIGCHSSTPDGMFAAVSASDDPGNGSPARIELRTIDGTGTPPSFLSASARTLLARTYQEQPVFSRAHWSAGDRIALSMLVQNKKTDLIWTDLEALNTTQDVGWGVIARGGDPGSAASANFSHDGKSVVYTSGASVDSGVNVYGGGGDIYTVPYNARKGGAASKLGGASDAMFNESYPSFSPDDQLVAFNRVANAESSYNDPHSELFVVASPAAGGGGGAATRLGGNDPPACAGKQSPGVTNSWAKWSPEVGQFGGKTYYWLTFSSTRSERGNPQLYVTAVVVGEGAVTTYGALYLWNQPEAEDNHTPAWDVFQIPVM